MSTETDEPTGTTGTTDTTGVTGTNGQGPKTFRRTDRTDAPLYLARYAERRSRQTAPTEGYASGRPPVVEPGGPDTATTPLYLRRFRERAKDAPTPSRSVPLEFEGERFSPEYAGVTRSHEIIPEARADKDAYVTEIRIIRHGITQGYSTDAGLTPMGAWQAHQRGQALARTLREWPQMRIVCADTNRARQTAEMIHRGLLDGLDQYGRDSDIGAPETVDELKNFQVWTPDGARDITASFRKYQAEMEKLERMAVGDRPRWLVEIDRFYRTQLGGADPIQQWLTIPLMYFESPQSCVRRFWRGFHRLVEESPGQRIIAATHSGPIRAFATWAHGYDPGEPVNTEEVVVRIKKGGRSATVSYRNRVTEVNVPHPDEMPDWEA